MRTPLRLAGGWLRGRARVVVGRRLCPESSPAEALKGQSIGSGALRPALPCAFLSPLPGNETTAQPGSSTADPGYQGAFMAWPGELAYLAASLTGKVMGLLNMDGIHDAIQILATGGSMPNLTPIPQQQFPTRSLRDPSQPPRSYLSRPNDSSQLASSTLLSPFAPQDLEHSHQGVYRPSQRLQLEVKGTVVNLVLATSTPKQMELLNKNACRCECLSARQ